MYSLEDKSRYPLPDGMWAETNKSHLVSFTKGNTPAPEESLNHTDESQEWNSDDDFQTMQAIVSLPIIPRS